MGLRVIASLWISTAAAHSALESTTPITEAVLATAPSTLLLTFNKGLRLVRVILTHDGQVIGPLDVCGQNGFANEHELALEGLGSGSYVIDWRGLSADRHAMNGSFGFTVE